MVGLMKGTGSKESRVEKEQWYGHRVINTQESGLIIKDTALVNYKWLMARASRGTGGRMR